MPETDIASKDVFGYLLCLVLSLSMLIFLVFIVIPDCADLAVASGGSARCETGSNMYLFGAAFAAVVLYAGYTICRILFPARFS